MLPNGATSNSSPYVTVPLSSAARTPPRFMTPTSPPPAASIRVGHEVAEHQIRTSVRPSVAIGRFTTALSGSVTARTSESMPGSGAMRSGSMSRSSITGAAPDNETSMTPSADPCDRAWTIGTPFTTVLTGECV